MLLLLLRLKKPVRVLQVRQDRQATLEQPGNVDRMALMVTEELLDQLDLVAQWVSLDHRDLLLQDRLESPDRRDLLEFRDHPVCRVARAQQVM